MKAVALILALAVITGCNARVVRQAEATKDPWEESVDRFWKYIAKLGQNADGVVENLKTSQLSMELDTLITDTMAELETYKNSIQTKLVPYTETATAQLSQDVQLLINRLQKDMLDAKEHSIEYHSELKATVDHNTGDLESRITTFTHKLQKHLKKDIEEIRSTVATWVGEIQSRASQNLDTLKEHVEPYVQQANDNTNKKLSDISAISAVLQSEAEGLGQQLQTQAEDIKTQLKATGEELRMSLQGKIEEMTELFSPYATKIREQFEEIVDKLKESTTA